MAELQQRAVETLQSVAGLRDLVLLPGTDAYESRIGSWWSRSARLRPWAIVRPRSGEDVALTVKTLVGVPGVQFAIRSGGRNFASPGSSNIVDGVTIDLGMMKSIEVDKERMVASLQPGATWLEVYSEVEKHGVMVAGGREASVGVGGLTTGGGITFYSCRRGFACDQVTSFEVVLADGSLVSANKSTNPDLFQALKGGSNNFGIVTRFDMEAFLARPLWDASRLYPIEATDAYIDALIDLGQRLSDKPNAHVLSLWMHRDKMPVPFIASMLVQLDGDGDDPLLDKFNGIPAATWSPMPPPGLRGVADKMRGAPLASDKHAALFSLTFKLDARVAKRATDMFQALLEECRAIDPSGGFNLFVVLQPLSSVFAKHSRERGGNVLGFERVGGDALLLAVWAEFDTPEMMERGYAVLKKAVDDIESYAVSIDASVDFRYLNYSDGSQDVIGSYGAENVRKMREVAARYDPSGVFQTRVPGGFKLSKARVDI